jgi:hypothetical protein
MMIAALALANAGSLAEPRHASRVGVTHQVTCPACEGSGAFLCEFAIRNFDPGKSKGAAKTLAPLPVARKAPSFGSGDNAKARVPFQWPLPFALGLATLIGALGEVMPTRGHGDEHRSIPGTADEIRQGQAFCRGATVKLDSTHGTLHAAETRGERGLFLRLLRHRRALCPCRSQSLNAKTRRRPTGAAGDLWTDGFQRAQGSRSVGRVQALRQLCALGPCGRAAPDAS